MIHIDGKFDELLMKVEVWPAQNRTIGGLFTTVDTTKGKDWTATLTNPPGPVDNEMQSSINKKSNGTLVSKSGVDSMSSVSSGYRRLPLNYLFNCDAIDESSVNELSSRLLEELRAAKTRHLTCTEVSIPCDLTSRIATEIIRVSEKEPCGIRGCTIFIEFEVESNNSRRIAMIKLDAETVSTFEIYLTLRQDHSGWTALLPQFMKSLARTVTLSPEFTITKRKLYSPNDNNCSSNGDSANTAISTPTS